MTEGYVPRLGDFARMSLDPQAGSEQRGERPVLVLSSFGFNRVTGYAFIAPVTRNRSAWPFKLPIPGGGRVLGAVLMDQVKSLDYRARFGRFLEVAPPEFLTEAQAMLATILGMEFREPV